MLKNLLKIAGISIIFMLASLFCFVRVEAKYVIETKYEIINIKNADNDPPYINEINYDVDCEYFNDDVTINYRDNLRVKYAKYWYNADSKEFEGEGTEFDSGSIFGLSGWYKIEVSDMYGNITTYVFCIDKEFDEIELSCTSITDEGGILEINATDNITGIQKIEIYINETFYDEYTYDEWFIKNKSISLSLSIDELPFYEEVYLIATDFCGNTKTSDKIIPNKNRIYDLQDLVKFRTVVNDEITNFENETIYLLNNIDLSSVCSESIGSWEAIGYSNGFCGIFEGNNYTISNLYINTSSAYSGLFGIVIGTIQDLTLNGTITKSGEGTGGIVGYLFNGVVENCTNNVNITTTNQYTGGVVGFNNGGEISYCTNNGVINGSYFVGGITGYSQKGSYVSYCYNSGNITGSNKYIGGIAGYTDSSNKDYSVVFCWNSGAISGDECVGGIAGAAWDFQQESVVISWVYNIGIITNGANECNGGIIGGTYYECFGEIVDDMNILKYGYNIGEIYSSGTQINQIGPKYMTCTDMYYVLGRDNDSEIGIAKSANLFREGLDNIDSVLYLLDTATSGVWTINSNYIDRKYNFCMAVKLEG